MDTRNVCSASILKRKNNKRRAKRNESVKVVYISTPMKVTTSASKFKSLVQQLTGRHSDIHRIMETNGTTNFEVFPDNHLDEDAPKHFDSHSLLLSMVDSCRESPPTTPESLMMDRLDDRVFSTQVDEQLRGMFPMDLFLNVNSSEFEVDVVGSYDAL